MSNERINCGERTVQAKHRVALGDIFRSYGIEQGDTLEVYIKIINHVKNRN
jgi:hypothetical protein